MKRSTSRPRRCRRYVDARYGRVRKNGVAAAATVARHSTSCGPFQPQRTIFCPRYEANRMPMIGLSITWLFRHIPAFGVLVRSSVRLQIASRFGGGCLSCQMDPVGFLFLQYRRRKRAADRDSDRPPGFRPDELSSDSTWLAAVAYERNILSPCEVGYPAITPATE